MAVFIEQMEHIQWVVWEAEETTSEHTNLHITKLYHNKSGLRVGLVGFVCVFDQLSLLGNALSTSI